MAPWRLTRPNVGLSPVAPHLVAGDYPPEVAAAVDTITNYPLEKLGERSYRLVTDAADHIGYLLDAIEEIVLP
jgi:hypothetical protein